MKNAFQTSTLTLTVNSRWCLDVQRESSDDDYGAGGETLNATGSPVYLYECDSTKRSQQWVFRERINETHRGEIYNRGTKLCLGWYSDIQNSRDTYLVDCDGTFTWDSRFFKRYDSDIPVHGSFYFDPYRNVYDRGDVQPRKVLD